MTVQADSIEVTKDGAPDKVAALVARYHAEVDAGTQVVPRMSRHVEAERAAANAPRLTSAQLFVLKEMRADPCSFVILSGHYTRTIIALQDKGALAFDADRGRYFITEAGYAALKNEAARRSA
jgi:hypothetical protein